MFCVCISFVGIENSSLHSLHSSPVKLFLQLSLRIQRNLVKIITGKTITLKRNKVLISSFSLYISSIDKVLRGEGIMHTFNLSIWDAEAGWSWIQDWPRLHIWIPYSKRGFNNLSNLGEKLLWAYLPFPILYANCSLQPYLFIFKPIIRQ